MGKMSFDQLGRYAGWADFNGKPFEDDIIEDVRLTANVGEITDEYVKLTDPAGEHWAVIYMMVGGNPELVRRLRKTNARTVYVRGIFKVRSLDSLMEFYPYKKKNGSLEVELKA